MFVALKIAGVPVPTSQRGICQSSLHTPLHLPDSASERHLVYGLDTGYDLTSFDRGDPIYRRNS